MVQSQEEILLGTKRTQLFFIIRAFFILLAIRGAYVLIMEELGEGSLAKSYPILTYLGLMGTFIIIDSRVTIRNKHLYLIKGLTEFVAILLLLIASSFVSKWVSGIIPLSQIFFAMILSASLDAIATNWRFGPTMLRESQSSSPQTF